MKSWSAAFSGKTKAAEVGNCIMFTGSVRKDGYGRIGIDGKAQLAHRISFLLATGIDPGAQFVLHRCDTPLCVNPEHLFLGDNDANMADMVAKQRQARGNGHGKVRFSEAEVAVIRGTSGNTKAVSARYGVTTSCIRKIRQGKRRIFAAAASCAVAATLSGCPGTVKPDLPSSVVIKPSIVYVDRYVYVPIRGELTAEQPVAEGALSQCPDVAAARKASLVKVNSQLRQIGAVQGTPAKP